MSCLVASRGDCGFWGVTGIHMGIDLSQSRLDDLSME
jgi:hypothetical protein